MKVLTTDEMREVDRLTIEAGIPGIVLMENAGDRVIEFMAQRFAPLSGHRIAVLCGKGNNGGDGMVVARQLYTRIHPESLHVILLADPADLQGDAAANYKMLIACGCPVMRTVPPDAYHATLVVDAILGTGLSGPASGAMLDGIRAINSQFPLAKVVAVDIPSGLPTGEFVRADCTVTFTAPKPVHVLPPACDHVGELAVAPIGSPESLYADVKLDLVEPAMFRALLAPREPAGHKGTYGHVLVVAGAKGKAGAAAMCGMGALRAGAGLVTVASSEPASRHAVELMSAPLPGAVAELAEIAEGKTVIGIGPGLGRAPEVEKLVLDAVREFEQPMVIDADALVNGIHGAGRVRVLTPHPGEMSRLAGKSTAEIQSDRVAAARGFATGHSVTLVLKGQRSLIAFPDGRVWINPTGTPAMGTGGTGDILTGLISGFLAQFPRQPDEAVAAAVYLHGLAGQIGARQLGEKCFTATDILKYLPAAIEECAGLSHAHLPHCV
jgi:NAD(P)H-hydrate epimerase